MNKLRYDTVVFDLLTGLIDSWSLWNEVAGCKKIGHKWRSRYLEITCLLYTSPSPRDNR